jgi:hypothetical protein
MSKAQNRKRRQANLTPQKAYNHTIKDLVESEGEESPVADIGRMMIRMFSELKKELEEDIQNYSVNPKRMQIKNLRRHRNN